MNKLTASIFVILFSCAAANAMNNQYPTDWDQRVRQAISDERDLKRNGQIVTRQAIQDIEDETDRIIDEQPAYNTGFKNSVAKMRKQLARNW